MKRTILVFSIIILSTLLLFKLGSYSISSGELKLELILGGIAILFFMIGLRLRNKTTAKTEHAIDQEKIKALGITSREYEVLKAVAQGLSNKEIGDKLFLSESTVKTHVSSLLIKLNAKRRTQALQIAKDHKII
jgi:DNA-binding NarL/FixJ family response regulator